MLLTSKYVIWNYVRVFLANTSGLIITLITRYFPFVLTLCFVTFFATVMRIISVTDFLLFCSNSA